MLAIVIPYYKKTFFDQTLRSLAMQTDKRFKVYICDDASPENPFEIINRFSNELDLVYHKFDQNMGSFSLVKQWNRSIKITNDEKWLMILGDDDFLGPDVIEKWYANLPVFEKISNVVRFATKTINEKLQTITDAYIHPQLEPAANFWFRRFKEETRSSLSEHVFSRQAFEQHGFRDYPLAWHSDDMSWLEFSGQKAVFSINDAIVYIRMSEINISGKSDNFLLKDVATAQFYKDLLTEKAALFNKLQRLELLMAYEVIIKRHREPNLHEWKLLLRSYLTNFKIWSFTKSLRRFAISIVKK